jgi:ribosomal protein L15E
VTLTGVVRRDTRRDMVAGVIRSVRAIRWRQASAPWRLNPPPRRDRARWAVAGVLNASGRTCWPDLVSWAMATREEQRKPRTRHPLRAVVGTGTCQRDALASGDCYCGKFTRQPAAAVVDAAGGA